MNKIIKLALFVLFIIGIIFINFQNVNAYSGELDPDSLISFPMMIINGKGNIKIKNSETAYSLYYQSIEVDNTTYSQLEQIKSNGKTELNNIKTELDALSKECENLQTLYNNAYEEYKEKLDSGVTGTELEDLKTAYETAKANYQNKLNEYNNKVDQYNTKNTELANKERALIPTYINDNWIKTEDGSFLVDISQFSGEKVFAIWAKLISSDGNTSYDVSLYTMSGTKAKDISVEGIELDKEMLELKVEDSYTLIPNITPSDATNKSITWTSDNENVAIVSNGKVTAKNKGTATITATTNNGNYTASCKVIVSEKKEILSGDKTSNDNEKQKDKNDDTTATGKLPQTGVSIKLMVGILTIIFIAGIFYKQYHNYKKI